MRCISPSCPNATQHGSNYCAFHAAERWPPPPPNTPSIKGGPLSPEIVGSFLGQMIGMLVVAYVVGMVAYAVGFADGRIYECRRSWETVDQAPAIWRECEARLGRTIVKR